MTNAEKRAQLKAEGEPWPDCECHGQPMLWQPYKAMTAGGRFRCRPHMNEWRRESRRKKQAAGTCIYCDDPLATEVMCRRCADAHADLMAEPKQRMLHQLAQIRYGQRLRADEGFQPTGVGLAAFAAWKGKQPGS